MPSMGEKEHNPLLIVIAGPNGSGKTSVTSRLLKHEWMEDAVYGYYSKRSVRRLEQ